jgi:serine/threonine-protein kinase ULK4
MNPGRSPALAGQHEAAGGQQEARVKLLGVQHAQQEHWSAGAKQQPYSSSSNGSSAPSSKQAAVSTQGEEVDAADSDADLQSLMWHPSDSAVKPIVANRRIERLAEPSWDAASLPFAPLTLQGMLDCDQAELERFLTQVYRTIASSAAVKQKVNLLAYFESLCSDTAAANVLINSSLTVLFVRMLRNGKLPLLRIRLASVLGLLIRHATFIADELASTHLVQILTEALSDINERVRRRYVPYV